MPATLALLQHTLAPQSGLRQAVLFGSVARGNARPESDLDIAVEFDHPLTIEARIHLMEVLAAATGRPIDLIDLKTVGEPLLGQILQHGKRIVGSDTDYAALISRHLLDNADFMPYVQRILQERRHAWIG